jgi:hypothetical protein
MPTPERFLALLKEQTYKHSLEALNPGKGDQTEFGYGKACGIAQGLQIAEALWNDQTAREERENEPQSGTTKR